ncbi:tRNase Z TRZ3, mitochondrial-like isoform X2 [Macadamia integrifolia]|uniref:tRNase Z TRZ3, mitochondrial-like isoform X2 n=1 Tax=Macadamia integrifolia TaxID=60698 RepID=UPI001C4F4C14|nr:tRNase Z TRZ3, mitochondrial-like isoform X2 [Macadamia integrifolia]
MPQIANFKLFFSANRSAPYLSPFVSFKPYFSPLLFKHRTPQKLAFPFTVLSSSAGRQRKPHPPPPPKSRSNSTLREAKTGEQSMEEAKPIGFNKRRAEGRDKSDRPKDLQLKVRKLNPVNTVSYVQILGTGMDTQDTSSSVLLFFDKQRFIFNAGEGLQRFCTEHKIKLSKIDHIFLSRVCSETAGGLPGLLLTLAGMGEEGMSVNVWGPSDLKYLVDAMRSFIPTAAMVHTHSFRAAPGADGVALADLAKFVEPIILLNNEVVKISAILLQPGCSEVRQQMKEDSSMLNVEEKKDQILKFPVLNSQDPNGKASPVLKPGDISVVYVCELPEIKGKFDPAKAVALGLKAGPKYRELQLGHSVMSDRQNIMVHPSDVLGPSVPGPIVLLVDCPTLSHLQELLSTQSLDTYYVDSVDQNLNTVKSVNCIIHLSPSLVTMTPEYQNWMKRFVGAQHIMAGHEIKNLEIPVLKSSARITARLNYLCPQFFPAPGFWSLQHLKNSMPEYITSCEFHLRPYAQLGLDKSGIPSLLTATEVVNELLSEIPEIEIAAEQVRKFWVEYQKHENVIISIPYDKTMVEEPWMQGDASAPDKNSGKQDASEAEEIQRICKASTDEINHESYLPGCLENIGREDMEFVLLGTGSSQPSKYRNVSSIYINLFSKGSLLFDCGEGTLGQLKRRFGVKGADDAVRRLRCIWISHIHADHHTGLARILALRWELLREVPHEPLLVIGPKQLKRFLDAYQKLEELDMQFLDCRHTIESSWDAFKDKVGSNKNDLPPRSPISIDDKGEERGVMNIETTLFARGSRMQSYWNKPDSPGDTGMGFQNLMKLKKVLDEAGLEALISVPVVHCPQAFGIVLKAAERMNSVGKRIPGWKLVYSGDTRPCPELIDASHGATVLIHEATFEDGMVEEAIAKNHSTTKEAIEVGASAGAYRIILTHFSQRYPKIPVFDETHMHKTCIAFDMMSINIADLPLLPEVLPYLKLLFKNEMMLDESDEAVCQAA